MGFSVIPAQYRDAQVLSLIGGSTFYETFRPYNSEEDMVAYISKAYDEGAIAVNLKNPDIHYALAFDENKLVGFIKISINAQHPKLNGKVAELEKIYVTKTHWGSGVGAALMDYVIEYVSAKQVSNLFLGVWNKNVRAITFYQKFGFEIFDERTFVLGSQLCNDHLMVLKLPQTY